MPLILLFSFVVKSIAGQKEPPALKKNDRDLKHNCVLRHLETRQALETG